MKMVIAGAVLLLIGLVFPRLVILGLILIVAGAFQLNKSDKNHNGDARGGSAQRPLGTLSDLSVFYRLGKVVAIQSRTVLNHSSHSSTSGGGGFVYGGTGTLNPTSTHSSTSTTSMEVVRYFIAAQDGDEFSIELNQPQFAVREGHRVSTFYAGNSAVTTKGMLVAIANHDTKRTYSLPESNGVDYLVPKPKWNSLGLIFGLAIGAYLVSGMVIAQITGAPLGTSVFQLIPAAALLVFGLIKRAQGIAFARNMKNAIVAQIDAEVARVVAEVAMADVSASVDALSASVGK